MARVALLAAAVALVAAGVAEALGVRGAETPSLSDLTEEFVVADELEFINEDEHAAHGDSESDQHPHVHALATMSTASAQSDTGLDQDLSNPLIVQAMPQEEVLRLAAEQSEQSKREAAIKKLLNHSLLTAREGAHLKQMMNLLHADIGIEDKILKGLAMQHEKLADSRQSLDAKLRGLVAPRIVLQERRVERKKKALEKVEQDELRWEKIFGKHRVAAFRLLRERKLAVAREHVAEEAVRKAQRELENARSATLSIREKTMQEVEAVKYAKTRTEGKRTEVQDVKEEMLEAEQALHKIQGIVATEEGRMNKALDESESKNTKKVTAAQSKKEQLLHAVEQTELQYKAWQKQRDDEAATERRLSKEWAAAQARLDAERLNASDSASQTVGKVAVNKSAFDLGDWAWAGGSDSDDRQSLDLA